MNDQLREFGFKYIHSTREIGTRDLLSIEKGTGLSRTSTTSADEDNLLGRIDFIHPEWQEMEGNISCRWNMYVCIFSSPTDIDEVNLVGSFFEE